MRFLVLIVAMIMVNAHFFYTGEIAVQENRVSCRRFFRHLNSSEKCQWKHASRTCSFSPITYRISTFSFSGFQLPTKYKCSTICKKMKNCISTNFFKLSTHKTVGVCVLLSSIHQRFTTAALAGN